MTQFVCQVCTYPSREGSGACDNPGCVANPRVTQAQKIAWAASRAERDAAEAERERIRAIQRRMAEK